MGDPAAASHYLDDIVFDVQIDGVPRQPITTAARRWEFAIDPNRDRVELTCDQIFQIFGISRTDPAQQCIGVTYAVGLWDLPVAPASYRLRVVISNPTTGEILGASGRWIRILDC